MVGHPQVGVENHWLGIFSMPVSYGQLRVISEDGVYADQDAVMHAPELMGKAVGGCPTQSHGFSLPSCDAASPALCIRQGYKRAFIRMKRICSRIYPVFNFLIEIRSVTHARSLYDRSI